MVPRRHACAGARAPNVEIAELAIGFGPFHEKFASRVVLAPDAPDGPRIDTTGIEGPFRRLVSRWIFHPHPDGCQIDFELEFDFRSILLQQTVRLLFAEAVKRMVTAFEARAKALYGTAYRSASDANIVNAVITATRRMVSRSPGKT